MRVVRACTCMVRARCVRGACAVRAVRGTHIGWCVLVRVCACTVRALCHHFCDCLIVAFESNCSMIDVHLTKGMPNTHRIHKQNTRINRELSCA